MKNMWEKLLATIKGWFGKKAKAIVPPIIVPQPDKPPAGDNEIKMDSTVKYTNGNPIVNGNEADAPPRSESGKRDEIWQHNWHGMNIRLYNNGGHVRDDAHVPQGSRWYPLRRDAMPQDAVTVNKTPDGAIASAKDFTSTSGQRYRFEGWFSDGKGEKLHRVYVLKLAANEIKGALIANWSSVAVQP